MFYLVAVQLLFFKFFCVGIMKLFNFMLNLEIPLMNVFYDEDDLSAAFFD